MKETIVKKNKKRLFLLLIGNLILLFGGFLMITEPDDSIEKSIGIIVIIFFTLGFIVILKDFISRK